MKWSKLLLFLSWLQTMPRRRQNWLARLKKKLVDNVDLLMFVFFKLFMALSFIQEKYTRIWLPLVSTALSSLVLRRLRGNRVPIEQYNYRKCVLLFHLLFFYLGFMILQNMRTPAYEKTEELLVMKYIIVWYYIGCCLDVLGNREIVVDLTIVSWILTSFGLLFMTLCYKGFINEKFCASCFRRLLFPWKFGINYYFFIILMAFKLFC